jgi:hypothetical protein
VLESWLATQFVARLDEPLSRAVESPLTKCEWVFCWHSRGGRDVKYLHQLPAPASLSRRRRAERDERQRDSFGNAGQYEFSNLAGARWPIGGVAFVVDNEATSPVDDMGAQDAFVGVAARDARPLPAGDFGKPYRRRGTGGPWRPRRSGSAWRPRRSGSAGRPRWTGIALLSLCGWLLAAACQRNTRDNQRYPARSHPLISYSALGFRTLHRLIASPRWRQLMRIWNGGVGTRSLQHYFNPTTPSSRSSDSAISGKIRCRCTIGRPRLMLSRLGSLASADLTAAPRPMKCRTKTESVNCSQLQEFITASLVRRGRIG